MYTVEFTIENAAKIKLQEKRKEAAEKKKKLRDDASDATQSAEDADKAVLGQDSEQEEDSKQSINQETLPYPSTGDTVEGESSEEIDTSSLSGVEFDEEGNIAKGNFDDSEIDFDMGDELETPDDEGNIGGFSVPDSLKMAAPHVESDDPRSQHTESSIQSEAAARALATAKGITKYQNSSTEPRRKRKKESPPKQHRTKKSRKRAK